MTKKKSPKEIIESASSPAVEQAFIHASDVELTDIAKNPSEMGFDVDEEKKERILGKSRNRNKYGLVHTHPYSNRREKWDIKISPPGVPSVLDIFSFLYDNAMKYSHIAQTDENTGKVEGYISLMKTKKTLNELKNLDSDDSHYSGKNGISRAISKYNIKIRYSPAQGYRYDNDKERFVRKDSGLEKVASTTAILGIGASILFIGSNLTGNAIANMGSSATNITGTILFLVGVVGAFFYFKGKKK